MKLYSLTDIGIKRSDNQDNYWSAILKVNDTEAGVVCLCDGMGGLNNGSLASRMVVEAVRDYILREFEFEGIDEVIKLVNQKILGMSGGEREKLMGTTCTFLLCYDGSYKIWHIGDSRAYLIRNGKETLLTTDHSAIHEYNIRKQDNEYLWNKYKNKLTRCIGVKNEILPDIYEGSYNSGDVFFLCSDGCKRLYSS